MYTFKKNIDINSYNKFTSNIDGFNFMQDPAWALVKNNFKNILVGVYEDEKLVLVASLLIRKVFLNFHLMYIPRGPVGNLENKELLSFFTKNIKQLAKDNKCYVVTIDPNVLKSQNFYRENNYSVSDLSINNKLIHQNFIDSGYKHQGFVKELDKSMQPRFHMAASLFNEDFLSIDDILKSYKSKVRYYLGAYQEKRGSYFEISSDVSDLDKFVSIINETEKRQNINLRNKSYFEKILTSFKDNAKLFFNYINLNTYLDFLENNNGKEEEILKVKEYLKKDNTLLLSASLVIMPSNKDGIKVAEYLYAGNKLEFNSLRVSDAIVFEIIKYCSENKVHYVNLGGVDGNFNDHLTSFKSKYNPVVFEYLGDYDLIINKSYYIIKYLLPTLKKINKKIRKK